jgi:vitamin B12 transporter
VLGLTGRALQSSYTSPGDLRTTNATPVSTSDFDHHLVTAFAEAGVRSGWSSRLTLGKQGYFLRGTSQFDGGDPYLSRLGTDRWVVDWQHRLALGSRVVAIGGATAEWAEVTDNDGRRDEKLRAGYADLTWSPKRDLTLSAGLRHDHYDTFGGRATGRLTAGYFVERARLKLRATYGTGFLPPSLAARYGGPFQNPNPEIRPERSRGWDAGVDQYFAGDRAVVSVTVFGNELRDLIGFAAMEYPALGQAINIDRARTRGLELSGRAVTGAIDLRAGYTYLRAEDRGTTDPTARRLIRRPRHAGTFDLVWSGRRLELGAGATAAADREDSDFNVFPFRRVDPGSYLDAHLAAGWRLGRGVTVRSRLDNLFDRRYEEVYGFPSLGRRLTVTLGFGAGGRPDR